MGSTWIVVFILAQTIAPVRSDAQVPKPLPTIALLCGDGRIELGEDCDPPGSATCPGGNGNEICTSACQCRCPAKLEFVGTPGALGVLDTGWTGLAHDSTVVSDGMITVAVTPNSCTLASQPGNRRAPSCGVCSFTGPIANAGAANYTAASGSAINNRRCTGNTRVTCTSNPDCSSAGGTCEFYFGSLLPLSAGGVSTCVSNQVNGAITGTANVESGTTASAVQLTSRVFGGATNPNPCPRCLGDATPNDGVRGGTCSGGTDNGLACDVNGVSPNAHFGTTSLDCRPSTSQLAALPIALVNSTGTETRTLSAASPNCRATGATSQKCFCDTCASLAAEPCGSNADCPGGRICGGLRCQNGTNAGGVCTVAGVNTQCPSGSCGRPGLATAPNQCDDATCTATTGNEGECSAGPSDFYCGPNATMIPCTSQADCDAAGLSSCTGGSNDGQVCTVAGDCPGGTCDIDTCTVVKTRPCYTDNGASGASVHATGAADVPVADESDPTLASLFCIGPVASSAVNAAAGLPGLGRLELPGHARGLP
jgi:hypothetical protein